MFDTLIADAGLADIYEKVCSGERLSSDDGLRLYKHPNLPALGYLANLARERMHGNAAYFVRNQHINYTNICNKGCLFCSFYALPKDPEGYILSPDEIREKVRAYDSMPISEIHMVGGVNPKLPFSYYLDIVRAIKDARPGVSLKAFTMIELEQIRRVAKKPLDETLLDLKEAGIDALPGGGAEVFSDRVHEQLFHAKSDSDKWLETARIAHQVGLPSNATMLYGHVEQTEEKVYHFVKLRELQDETNGFLAFIPLSWHPERTEIAHLPGPTGQMDLREVALARLMLDNVPHIKSFWIMNSPAVTQVALWYGADDMDGSVLEYEITRDPKTDRMQALTHTQMLDMIAEAGREPVERDALYRVIDRPEPVTPVYLNVGQETALFADSPIRRFTMINDIAEKVYAGERLGYEDGLRLFRHPNVAELGMLADHVRWQKHPDPVVTYNIGRNINYTNVCWVRCKFCSFYRPPGHDEGYTLPDGEIFEKIGALIEAGGDEPGSCEILMQGGLNPRLKIDYYERLFSKITRRHPSVYIHSLSVAELVYIAHISKLSVEETLIRLRDAGLQSLPGAGAEILDDEVREAIAHRKETAQEWLDVHRAAHRIGMKSTATMMFGSVETITHRLEHLMRVREVQDEALAGQGGYFTAFIAWSFQPEGTELEGIRKATGYDYLRTVAVARMMLDNISNIQASYVTQGPKIAQIALRYGVNDFGSTMMEENVISAGGVSFVMPMPEIERLIQDAGFEARRRNTRYERAGAPVQTTAGID